VGLKVSIVIPARNEEETLERVLADLRAVIQKHPVYEFEIVIVDDHSSDRTAQKVKEGGARLVSNLKPPGKGNALQSGFEQAQGDIIIMMDADYSHRAEEIPIFLELMQNGFGLVVGSRWTGGSEEYTFVRGFGNIFLTACFWMVTGHLITDALNGFKAFRTELIRKNPCRCEDFEIEIELLINALYSRYKIGEFSSYERERAGGQMKSSVVRHGWRFFWSILRLGVPYRIRHVLGTL